VVFDGLLDKLRKAYPQLTHGDLKLLAYLKLNLNNKEIADLLNISHRSVEVSKYRLRRKLNLKNNDKFDSILGSLSNLK
jgi:DNA-binding CsgD family transcriptional regulator